VLWKQGTGLFLLILNLANGGNGVPRRIFPWHLVKSNFSYCYFGLAGFFSGMANRYKVTLKQSERTQLMELTLVGPKRHFIPMFAKK
jgi:hypothetical protein